MPEPRYRLLIVCTHPVQYASPVFREMARHPQLDIQVAYCNMQGAEAGHDPEFGMDVKWDVPLLDGYPWTLLPNRSLRPGLGRFWGLLNPGLWHLIRSDKWDAVQLLTGYVYATFWIGLAASKISRVPAIFGTDGTTIRSMNSPSWKRKLKPFLLPRIFSLADFTYGASAASRDYLKTLGVPEERIAILPLVADNDWWLARSAEADRAAMRQGWGIGQENPIILFSAKLQPWKRPMDLLRAFAQANLGGAHLVFAGEGPLKATLENEAAHLEIQHCVHFLGFVNQSHMPGVYSAADLFVLPSDYDACPAAICETMLCGTPAVISDEIRGRFDIVRQGETGFIFPCGDVTELAKILREALANSGRLERMRAAARRRMAECSPAQNVANLVAALERLTSQIPAAE